MAKSSKYNRARIRSRVRRPKRRSGSMMWTVTTVVVVVLGVLLVTLTYADRQNNADAAPTIGDHWHAFLGVDVCGTWLPNAPSFEDRADQAGIRAGLHSHGDGLMHIHPFASDEAGAKATVGRFLGYGGWSAGESSFKVWDDKEHKTGNSCGSGSDAKKAEVQWTVGKFGKPWSGTPRSGSISDYHPVNGDIVALYLLPKGEKLPKPPKADAALTSISDLNGQSVTATTAPAGGSTTTSPPIGSSTTVPAGNGSTATTTP